MVNNSKSIQAVPPQNEVNLDFVHNPWLCIEIALHELFGCPLQLLWLDFVRNFSALALLQHEYSLVRLFAQLDTHLCLIQNLEHHLSVQAHHQVHHLEACQIDTPYCHYAKRWHWNVDNKKSLRSRKHSLHRMIVNHRYLHHHHHLLLRLSWILFFGKGIFHLVFKNEAFCTGIFAGTSYNHLREFLLPK